MGTSVFDVPGDWALDSVSASGDAVTVVAGSSAGDECTIVAAHVGAMGALQSYMTKGAVATEIMPHVGGEPVSALRLDHGEIDARYHLVWATGTTDVIDLACVGQLSVEELAPRIWSPYQ